MGSQDDEKFTAVISGDGTEVCQEVSGVENGGSIICLTTTGEVADPITVALKDTVSATEYNCVAPSVTADC